MLTFSPFIRKTAVVGVGFLLVFAMPMKGECQEEEGFSYEQLEAFLQKIPETQENIRIGRRLYQEKCVWCHGIDGDGRGAAAMGMGERGNPKPRNFRTAQYKIRSTETGQLPMDEDLFNTLTRGMPGTSMLAWSGLSEEERWQLVYYIKTFSDRFKEETPVPITIDEPGPPTFKNLAKGRWLYHNIECGKCHGPEGRGNGPSAAQIKDSQENPIRVADLNNGGNFIGGNSVIDIYRTLYTGLGGSAMPSFAGTITDDQLWHLTNYVHALSIEDSRVQALRQFWITAPPPLASQSTGSEDIE